MLALWEAGVQEDSVQDFEMQEYDPALIAMRCGDDFADAAISVRAPGLRRVRIDLAYDGSFFSGWARQPSRVTVQGVLESALELILRSPHRVTVAGRTDAGVHAEAQTVHLDITEETWQKLTGREGNQDPACTLHRRLTGALRRTLGEAEVKLGLPMSMHGVMQGAIRIHRVCEMPANFDARFSATGRRYIYRIADGQQAGPDPLRRTFTWGVPERLTPSVLNEAAADLLGLRDFLSFCKPREGATTIRELRILNFMRTEEGLIEAHIVADAFCHHMVRSIIGALVLYASGKRTREWLRGLIDSPARDASLTLAPPQGLSLAEIYCPAPEEYGAQAERARRMRTAATAG